MRVGRHGDIIVSVSRSLQEKSTAYCFQVSEEGITEARACEHWRRKRRYLKNSHEENLRFTISISVQSECVALLLLHDTST